MKKFTQGTQSKVCKHVSHILGDNHRVAPHLIKEIQFWTLKSGEEWTVSRLKALKQAVMLFLETETDLPRNQRSFPCPEWFKKTKSGWPKGHLGGFLTKTLRYGKREDLSKLIAILNVYTAFISKKITSDQQKKKE